MEHKYEAEDLLRRLHSSKKINSKNNPTGSDEFSVLAQKHSKCSSHKQGGYLGEIELKRLDEDFAEAALLLKTDEISPIVRTRFGYHIIRRHK